MNWLYGLAANPLRMGPDACTRLLFNEVYLMVTETLTLPINSQLLDLFKRYQAHTQVTPEQYIEALLSKTQPTLQAVVEALDESGGDSDALAQLFASKMAHMTKTAEPVES